jgi:hypothetical protein
MSPNPLLLDGLSYADTLPLEFRARAAPLEPAELARLSAENLQVLIADASLEEQRAPVDAKSDADHALMADLQRLEFKVNVLIELVARLMKRSDALPPARAYRLYANGLEWLSGASEVLPGMQGIVALHVSRRFPHPLELPGVVAALREETPGTWVQFGFHGLAPVVTDQLEKLIFRHHRRSIADARAFGARPGSGR